jgi:hypothetical protein
MAGRDAGAGQGPPRRRGRFQEVERRITVDEESPSVPLTNVPATTVVCGPGPRVTDLWGATSDRQNDGARSPSARTQAVVRLYNAWLIASRRAREFLRVEVSVIGGF